MYIRKHLLKLGFEAYVFEYDNKIIDAVLIKGGYSSEELTKDAVDNLIDMGVYADGETHVSNAYVGFETTSHEIDARLIDLHRNVKSYLPEYFL